MYEILINKPIGSDYWGDGEEISADYMREEFKKVPEGESKIRLTIDSPGGDVFEGISIFNIIVNFARANPEIEIESYILGMAASMASVIALAANSVDKKNKVCAENNSTFMIHNAWGIVIGNANDMRAGADWFERIDNIIRNTYALKTGKNEKEIRKMMDSESWFFGKEILENGFCDSIFENDKPADKDNQLTFTKAKFDKTQSFMREKTVKAGRKFDFAAAASVLGLSEIHQAKTAGNSAETNKSFAGDGGLKNAMEGCMEITVEDLKKENPEIYAQILKEGEAQGVEKEKARASRFLQMGEKAGCKDFALECIANGSDPMSTDIVDAFFDKGVLAKRIQDKIEEDKETPDLNNLPKNSLDDSEELFRGFGKVTGGQ